MDTVGNEWVRRAGGGVTCMDRVGNEGVRRAGLEWELVNRMEWRVLRCLGHEENE